LFTVHPLPTKRAPLTAADCRAGAGPCVLSGAGHPRLRETPSQQKWLVSWFRRHPEGCRELYPGFQRCRNPGVHDVHLLSGGLNTPPTPEYWWTLSRPWRLTWTAALRSTQN